MIKNRPRISKTTKKDRLSMILKILEFMGEENVGKDWLLKEVKKNHILGIRPFMNNIEILKKCPFRFISYLYDSITNTTSPGPRPSNLPPIKHLHWFYTDVVASSNPKITTREQVHKIMVLNDLISRTENFKKQDPKSLVVLPSGDGYAIGFEDTIETPLKIAIELHTLLNKYNQTQTPKDRVYIRSGIESGIVYFMKDLNGNYTVWGPGIIMARRVMDLGEKMHILTSEGVAKVLGRLTPEYRTIMHPIGKYPVKWEGETELFNIYEKRKFGNVNPPAKPTIVPKYFEFDKVELILDIKNAKTMMTHHTQIWNLINVSKESRDLIHYTIDGDTPRNFPDLHVRVTDSKGKILKIQDMDARDPKHKEFNVKLDRPIKPNSTKFLKLEWDWEEPFRSYLYKFSSDCKKFRYILNISNNIGLKQRVLKIVPELGQKEYASTTPLIRYHDDKTVLFWEQKDVLAHDAYMLEW
ncbi:MAG TPA: adenylate/guanylate cyclase domain-containing protein [Nitrosopumilaceae archaeon]|nr:adenylate/guanylate cyclase domain-containing protein [Nitrosopumilaceae archaeon]